MEQFPQRFGKYILLDRIASGGMAEVFRAKVMGAENFHRLVAIKCILPHLVEDDEFCRMFVDEAKLASNLSHANISQIYELGNHGGRLYIVMELIAGFNLRELTKRVRKLNLRLPDSLVAYIISKAAEGLDYAHEMKNLDGSAINLVHRDVSPQNILLSFDGAVKLVDFGIAKAEQRLTETQSGVLKGKFSYMAPEQVRGNGVDKRSDIFALGCVLWELLAGKKAFQGETDLEILEKVRNPKLRPIHQVDSQISEVFSPIVEKAMATNPAERYQRAHELAEALQPLMIDQKVIVGSRVAAEFMQHLYQEEIENLKSRYQVYSALQPEDCDLPEPSVGGNDHTKVFASFFEEAGQEAALRKPFQVGDASRKSALPPLHQSMKSAKPVVRQATGSSQIKIEPTDSGSISLADIPSVGGGPTVLLRVLIAAIVVLTLSIAVIHNYTELKTWVQESELMREASPRAGDTAELLGYVEIHAGGAEQVEVYINGDLGGFAPLKAYAVPLGTVSLRLVEKTPSGPGRVEEVDVLVSDRHTQDSPLRLTIPLD